MSATVAVVLIHSILMYVLSGLEIEDRLVRATEWESTPEVAFLLAHSPERVADSCYRSKTIAMFAAFLKIYWDSPQRKIKSSDLMFWAKLTKSSLATVTSQPMSCRTVTDSLDSPEMTSTSTIGREDFDQRQSRTTSFEWSSMWTFSCIMLNKSPIICLPRLAWSKLTKTSAAMTRKTFLRYALR